MTPIFALADRDVLGLLGQATIWRSWDARGQLVTHQLDDVEPRHQARILGWLRAHADILANNRRAQVAREFKRGRLGFEEFATEMRYLDALDPVVWLEAQPLVRRLVALVVREPLPARGLLGRIRRRYR